MKIKKVLAGFSVKNEASGDNYQDLGNVAFSGLAAGEGLNCEINKFLFNENHFEGGICL